MAEEEEILKEGGAEEEEVDGNRDKVVILMHVGHVKDMGIIQTNAIIGKMIGVKIETNKGIMHQHQIGTMMSAYLLCSI